MNVQNYHSCWEKLEERLQSGEISVECDFLGSADKGLKRMVLPQDLMGFGCAWHGDLKSVVTFYIYEALGFLFFSFLISFWCWH